MDAAIAAENVVLSLKEAVRQKHCSPKTGLEILQDRVSVTRVTVPASTSYSRKDNAYCNDNNLQKDTKCQS